MIPRPLSLRDGRFLGLVAYTDVLQGTSDVVSSHYGLTRKRAHAKAILALARILEKDLTARYEH